MLNQLVDDSCISQALACITNDIGFLNAIVANLWPNINMATAQIAKESVEPLLASTLPSPLSNLRFVKFDLGHVPMKFSNVNVTKTSETSIKLDLDVDWEGTCDIELDGSMVPKVVSCVFWCCDTID